MIIYNYPSSSEELLTDQGINEPLKVLALIPSLAVFT